MCFTIILRKSYFFFGDGTDDEDGDGENEGGSRRPDKVGVQSGRSDQFKMTPDLFQNDGQ